MWKFDYPSFYDLLVMAKVKSHTVLSIIRQKLEAWENYLRNIPQNSASSNFKDLMKIQLSVEFRTCVRRFNFKRQFTQQIFLSVINDNKNLNSFLWVYCIFWGQEKYALYNNICKLRVVAVILDDFMHQTRCEDADFWYVKYWIFNQSFAYSNGQKSNPFGFFKSSFEAIHNWLWP